MGRLEPDRSRRGLCALLPLLASGRLRAAERLPARNLVVELRLVDAATVAEGSAAGGSVRIDSRGNLSGSVGVGSLGSTRGASQGVQAVRVLNGGQARMQVVQTQALAGAVAAWAGHWPGDPGPPRWGGPGARPGGAAVTAWAELVDGFDVRPRWPGGQAPVTVEVGATRSTGPAAGNAPPPRFQLFTTVQVVPGEWTELARIQHGGSATVGTGGTTLGTQRATQLQLRITPAD